MPVKTGTKYEVKPYIPVKKYGFPDAKFKSTKHKGGIIC